MEIIASVYNILSRGVVLCCVCVYVSVENKVLFVIVVAAWWSYIAMKASIGLNTIAKLPLNRWHVTGTCVRTECEHQQ